ncbi:MAG: energy transducer TonB [Cyanobacteria bacterium J06600_6]
MSYESQLNRQSSKLINPAQLCFLLSVALHLLVLKFGLPTIRFNNDSGQREVSVIELNSEQQARLPEQYSQPETPDIPNLNLPQPDLSDPAAPFAIPPDLLGLADPSTLPPLIIPPPPTFNIPSLPPITDITLPPIGDISDLPLPPNINLEDFNVEPIKLPPNLGKVPETPSELPEVKTPSETQPTAIKPDNQKPTVEKPEIKIKETAEQIAARKVVESQKRIDNLRRSLTKTKKGTTNEEARKNYIVWLAKVQDIEPKQLEIKGAYPRDACIKRLKGSSVFGAVVNAKGEVVALDLIKGSRYPLFNQQANKDISDRTFANDTGEPKPYQVKVNYEYDAEICPSLTLPSIRRAEEKQQAPEPKPEPTPAPKPIPEAETKPEPKPESTPTPEAEPKPTPEAETKPESTPTPEAEPTPEPKPEPEPTPEPKPLRDRLRDIPLPDLDPSKLKDIPLPDRPNF